MEATMSLADKLAATNKAIAEADGETYIAVWKPAELSKRIQVS